MRGPRRDGYHDWYVIAVTPCCGTQSHTEIVATFIGYLHNAQRNAEIAVQGRADLIRRQQANYEAIGRAKAAGNNAEWGRLIEERMVLDGKRPTAQPSPEGQRDPA